MISQSMIRVYADTKFPFEIDYVGELVEGFFFREVTLCKSDSSSSVEIMISKLDGTVIFPGNLKLSFPFVQLLHSKIYENLKGDENRAFRCNEELVRVINPRRYQQLMIFPKIDKKLIPIMSDVYQIPLDKFQAVVDKNIVNASKLQKSLASNESVFVIITDDLIREYKLINNSSTNELIAMSMITAEVIPRANLEEKEKSLHIVLPPSE
jgi:hypothetical protein